MKTPTELLVQVKRMRSNFRKLRKAGDHEAAHGIRVEIDEVVIDLMLKLNTWRGNGFSREDARLVAVVAKSVSKADTSWC